MSTSLSAPEPTFFGHPRGLSTLFFTEMWERFSYYGMRALLILFMTDVGEQGGSGHEHREATSGAIYGLYVFGVYALALAGRLDRRPPDRDRSKAVLYGGVLIAAGALRARRSRSLIERSTAGLIADRHRHGIAQAERQRDRRRPLRRKRVRSRDAGFSIFYMGINIGAFLGPAALRVGRRAARRLPVGQLAPTASGSRASG